MKKLFFILCLISSILANAQSQKNVVDSFIRAKTSDGFMKLLNFKGLSIGELNWHEKKDSTIHTFRYDINIPSGEPLYYTDGGITASHVFISINDKNKIVDPNEMSSFYLLDELKKMGRVFSSKLVSKQQAFSTAEKYLLHNDTNKLGCVLIYDLNTDTIYWNFIADSGTRKRLKQNIYIDAETNDYAKTEEIKYEIWNYYNLNPFDDDSFPDNSDCLDCTEDSSNLLPKIEPDYFLLGTLSDYLGRFEYVDRETQIDIYYPFEEPMVVYLNQYIKDNYDDTLDIKFKTSRHSETFNENLAKKLNKYYGNNGALIDSLFKTENQVYSFLLGNYYRFGEKLSEKIYSISIVNSPKDKQLYPMLKKINCDKIIYKLSKGGVPSSQHFYFEAPAKLITYFNLIEHEKEKLTESYYKRYSAKYRNKIMKHKKEMIKNIESIFGK